jgi:hypothetical protein
VKKRIQDKKDQSETRGCVRIVEAKGCQIIYHLLIKAILPMGGFFFTQDGLIYGVLWVLGRLFRTNDSI